MPTKIIKNQGQFLRQFATIKIDNYRQFVNIFCCGLEECAGALTTHSKMICSKLRMRRMGQIFGRQLSSNQTSYGRLSEVNEQIGRAIGEVRIIDNYL